MILAFYLPKFTSTVEIEIEIDENGISRKWIKQFIFQNKIDNKIKWNEIENYVFQPDRQFDKFKLNLKSNRKFVFYHNNDHDTKDDFIAFVSDFAVKVNEINSEENKSKEEKIKLGKTIYETTGGLILAILGVILIVGLPILFILSPHKGSVKTSNYAMLGASYLGTIYYLVQVYTHRKKRKEYEENL
ncbi:hypothetical protein SAMN05660477_00416 [Soonwooa buanensis]|uniref:Uncharacterized protein n=1 Tax=Soonwooa buanensis TaxID=619805 RepID=A0A1T5CWR1_9FLAO|nr:hypothetical protein [Soonwooa buanensis]SKB63803.1 hypothetical protein SAMN05660477_00416 [Soonwooa buanensis]